MYPANDTLDRSELPSSSVAPSGERRPVFWLGVVGVVLTVAAVAYGRQSLFGREAPDVRGFGLWMTISFAAGFALRTARRKIFTGKRLSLHKAASFDAIFQGAILLNPQLPYPSVEREFLCQHTGLPPELVSPWFRIRSTSALSIPLVLAGITAGLGGRWLLGGTLALAGIAWVVFRARVPVWAAEEKWRFAVGALFGIAAAVTEGLALLQASLALNPAAGAWDTFLLYGVLLTAFELSPLPFALGVLELSYLVFAWLFPALVLPGLLVPLAYRAWRAVPVLLLTAFYLPRYKMSLGDLYDPRLPVVLSSIRRHLAIPQFPGLDGSPALSVVVPAYNEAERLPRYLPDVIRFCEAYPGGAEIVVVDDGSRDRTAAYVQTVSATHPTVRLVAQETNRGKGEAVRRGVAEARGSYILFADADGATPITEASKLLAAAQEGAEVVIGSRKAAGEDVQRSRSLLRELAGSVFYRVTNLLAVPGVADTQCGFKLFARQAARRIFPLLRETGWAFDVELLFLAQKFGMSVEEVPVNWTAVEGSKVRPHDALKMFAALLRIRRRDAGLTARQ